jgi:uncharacterized cupredoxin-like copper-binding protein
MSRGSGAAIHSPVPGARRRRKATNALAAPRFSRHTNLLSVAMNTRSFALLAACTAFVAPAFSQQKLELKKGDRIAILGGSVADRMQHTGYLEALIQQKFAGADLAFRNLGVAADEVGTWHRSQNFGSREEWLKRTGATVVFAFYGYNESFKGYEGVDDFKKQLTKFVTDTRAGGARVVLFSPIAAEKHQSPDFADPAKINENVQNYAAAVADVAKAHGVQFVDLLGASQAAYKAAAAKGESLTINGWFLSDAGDRALAPAMFQGLFGEAAPAVNEKLRVAVNEKNWQFHQRYRTIDGYNVYGGRSFEKYQPKIRDESGKVVDKPGTTPIVNNPVMQREMSQRDVMAANREARVWAIAKGGDLVVKDDNLPEPIPVYTNKPGDKPDLSHTYPSGEEAIAKMKVAPNLKVSLFADEKMFPELANPVQMAFDTKGRLWVAVWPNYPEREPTSKVGDKLLIFEDTNADGKADKCTTFMDDLNGPTGFTFYKDGVLVMQAPDLWWVRDTNGDGKGDWKERLAMGIDSADSHHTTNAMVLDPGGATFFSDGVFHRTQIETPEGPKRHSDGCLWRFEPRTGKTDLYAAYELVNPHGKAFDRWGNDLVTHATGNHTYFAPAISGRLDSGKHPGMKQFWERPSRPCPGTGMVSSAHFPEDWQGDFLNANVIGLQAITRVNVTQDGSGLKGETVENIVSADPAVLPTFRPICVSNGPDGAIWFCDWSQTIIGHLQHHLRDPNRDHQHGRVYRITYEGRPLAKPVKIDGQPIEALLENLKLPLDDTRTLTKVELDKHPTEKVIPAVKKWAAAQTDAHAITEALWVHQWHNVADTGLLKRVLSSPEPQARAAAVRVLTYWRDRVPDALALMAKAAADADPRVRLFAARGASFFDGKDVPAAAQVAYTALGQDTDYYLDYVIGETLRQLRSLQKDLPFPADAKAAAKLVAKMSDGELANAPKSEITLRERLARKTSDAAVRDAALADLAKLKNVGKATMLVSLLKENADKAETAEALAKQLALITPSELAADRTALLAMALDAKNGNIQRAGLAAIVVADQQPGGAWTATANDATARRRLIESARLVPDPAVRAKFLPLLTSALAGAALPAEQRTAIFRTLPLMGDANAKNNFTLLANALRAGTDRAVTAAAIMQLPRESWSRDAAGPVAGSILAWVKTVPANQRSAQDVVSTMQFGGEIAGLLPAADATRIRRELRSLGVPVFVLHTVHEKMSYDQKRIVVEAGKPFEIILVNADTMPHNLAVVKPGTHEKVGTAASTMTPDKLDKQGRAYIPKSTDILEATKILEPGQKETLKVTIPTEGEYEYVCTMPGHYVIMWGRLIVTKDVDAYLAANPDATAGPVGAPHEHKK